MTSTTEQTLHRIAPDAPTYITIAAAADALASRPWTVAELIEDGELRAIHYGNLTLVSAYDVEQLGGVTVERSTIAAETAPIPDPSTWPAYRAYRTEPANREALLVLEAAATGAGLTIEEVARMAGVAPDADFTVEDVEGISITLGALLGNRHAAERQA